MDSGVKYCHTVTPGELTEAHPTTYLARTGQSNREAVIEVVGACQSLAAGWSGPVGQQRAHRRKFWVGGVSGATSQWSGAV